MKKRLALLVCLFLMMGSIPAFPQQAEAADHLYYLLRPESFMALGNWMISNYKGALDSSVLQGPDRVQSGNEKGPSVTLSVPNGEYFIWVRSCDFPLYNPGTRTFYGRVNGIDFRKNANEDFGTHGKDRYPSTNDSSLRIFWWEKMEAPSSVTVTDGKLSLEILAQSGYARFDALLVTDDPAYRPQNSQVGIIGGQPAYAYDYSPAKEPTDSQNLALLNSLKEKCIIPYLYQYGDELQFPGYAKQPGTVQSTQKLSNSNLEIAFQLVSNGSQNYVQRQTKVNGAAVDSLSDGLGWLCMYANSAQQLANGTSPVFKVTYEGQELSGKDLYKAGYPSWLVPSTLERLDNGAVRMTAQNEFASMEAIWTLDEGDKEPKVAVNYTARKNGNYSFGMFYAPSEIAREDTKFIQVPYRYQEKRIPDYPIVVAESHSTTALTQATTNTGYKVNGKDVTYGVVVDPSALNYRWVYMAQQFENVFVSNGEVMEKPEEQSDYGLSIVGPGNGVLPGLFAPLMCSDDSNMAAGTVFEYAYRPMVTVSEPSVGSWYDSYEHVIQDILKVTDYRDNYFSSLTDTIFNFYDLLMDDYYSGWDEDGKAHYNMEGRNIVTVSDPLTYLQLYLLTEDEDLYERRTLPTMEYMLSRKGQHFAQTGPITKGEGLSGQPAGSTSYFEDTFAKTPEGYGYMGLPEGVGIQGMGNSVYAGAYEMTMGQVPAFRNIAASQVSNSHIAQPVSGGLTNPSELLWMAKTTQLPEDMQKAISAGNDYVEKRVETPHSSVIPDENFIYIDFYPHMQSMMDMYYTTQDETYLNAAKESGRRLLTTLWSAPMPDLNTNDTMDSKKIMEFASMRGGNTLYWHGDFRLRIGLKETFNLAPGINRWQQTGYESTALVQKDETVPQWVPSRVGLGIEQTSTFSGNNSNIIMSTWAGDLMRLAELTGDDTFETFARNSIVGRYENYPGYYHNALYTYPYYKDFPYKGPELTNIYYHHIPVLMGALQDFLFSQAYHWSGRAIDFPMTRNQGYAWFNNNHYGFAPGKVFDEDGMWLWLKKELVKTGNKQLDWFGTRKDGRAAFVFMNAAQDEQTAQLEFGTEVGLPAQVIAVLTYQDGTKETKSIQDGKLTITLPKKGLVSVAFDADVSTPNYAKVDAAANEYGGRKTKMGETHVYTELIDDKDPAVNDINGYVLQIDPDSYYAYIYTNHRPQTAVYKKNGEEQKVPVDKENGINAAILYYRLSGETDWTSMADDQFPFEFQVKVEDPTKKFEFKVEFERENGQNVAMQAPLTLSTQQYYPSTQEDEKKDKIVPQRGSTGTLCGYAYKESGIPVIENTRVQTMDRAGNYMAFCYFTNQTNIMQSPIFVFALFDRQGRFLRVAGMNQVTLAAGENKRIDTIKEQPIQISEEEKGCHVVIFTMDELSQFGLRPFGPKFDFASDQNRY